MSNPNDLSISQTELPEQQAETPEDSTSWVNPGEFPEFMSGVEKPSSETEDEDDWSGDGWRDDDIDWNDSFEGPPVIEETPEQKVKREAELAEKKRQEKMQIELERWDEDDTLMRWEGRLKTKLTVSLNGFQTNNTAKPYRR